MGASAAIPPPSCLQLLCLLPGAGGCCTHTVPPIPPPPSPQDLTFPLIEKPDSFVVQVGGEGRRVCWWEAAACMSHHSARHPESLPLTPCLPPPPPPPRPLPCARATPTRCVGDGAGIPVPLPPHASLHTAAHVGTAVHRADTPPGWPPPSRWPQDYLSELKDPMSTIYSKSELDRAMTVACECFEIKHL